MSLPPATDPPRKVILFVDDDEGMRAAIYGMFSPRYEVMLAVNGLDGYAKASGPPRPDLIVADVAMPELDGIAMAQRIRANHALRRIPIIFLTGRMAPASLIAGLSLGSPFAYLPKATDPRVLETKVRRALGEA